MLRENLQRVCSLYAWTYLLTATSSLLAGCDECVGKTGAELEACEAESKAEDAAKAASQAKDLTRCRSWTNFDRQSESGSLVSPGVDCFAFDVDQVGAAQFTISDNQSNVLVTLVVDENGNGTYDSGEDTAKLYASEGTLELPLEVGRYYVQLSGDKTSYELTATFSSHPSKAPATNPGNDPASAYTLAALDGKSIGGYVGSLDELDVYAFTLEKVGKAEFTVSEYTSNVAVGLVRDENENGRIDSGETFIEKWASEGTLGVALGQGTYFLSVSRGPSTYTLNASFTEHGVDAPDVDPGEKPRDALPIEPPSDGLTLGGYVGTVDSDDYYAFTVSEVGFYEFTAADYVGNVLLGVVLDKNGNGTNDSGEEFVQRWASEGTLGLSLEKGQYYLHVSRGDTAYSLTATYTRHVTGSPKDEPGEKPNSSALAITVPLAATGGYVGTVDPEDFYAFELDGARTVQITLADTRANVRVGIVEDRNGNGTLDSSEELVGAWASEGTLSRQLEAGQYFLRIYGGDSVYTLTVALAN